MIKQKKYIFVVIIVAALFYGCKAARIDVKRAIARLQSPDGDVLGVLEFEQRFISGAPTTITGTFKGLPESDEFGLKIMEYGNMTQGCLSVGPEFNPDGWTKRVDSRHPRRRVGTLGNVKHNRFSYPENYKVSLFGRNSVIGRSVVLFEHRDDGAEFSTYESQTTGSVGRPVACGIIGRLGSSF